MFLNANSRCLRQDYRRERNNAVMERREGNNKKEAGFFSLISRSARSDNSPANSLRRAARWLFDVGRIV